jgi:hypothetical protein
MLRWRAARVASPRTIDFFTCRAGASQATGRHDYHPRAGTLPAHICLHAEVLGVQASYERPLQPDTPQERTCY